MDDTSDLTDQLAAAYAEQHQEETQVETETTGEPQATPETKTTVEETPTAEKPAETKSEATQPKDEATEPELGVDDTGKRYVPESRFKDVYAKWKAAERKAQLEIQPGIALSAPEPAPVGTQPAPIDKTTALEIELLKGKLPQFDPETPEYDQTLDAMAFDIYQANKNKGMTMMQAAKRAISFQKTIADSLAKEKIGARTVKALQSDQGITNRVLNRESTEVDVEKMTLEQKEAWLKEHGEW